MTINPGHIPVGTIYQQKVFAGGNEQDIEIECGPTGPGSTAPLLNTSSSPFTYNNNTQSAQFLYQCENCYAYQFSSTSCYAGPNNTGIVVTLAYVSGSNTEIVLTFQAGSNVAAGNWPIYCNSSAGLLVPAGYVVVEAPACSPSISSVQVNGQQTNTIIAGTSGYVSINGKCLGGTQSVQFGGSGISVSSYNVNLLDSNNDYQVNAYFQSSTSASTGTQTVTLSSAEGNTSGQVNVVSAADIGAQQPATPNAISYAPGSTPASDPSVPAVVPSLSTLTSSAFAVDPSDSSLVVFLKNSGPVTASLDQVQPAAAVSQVRWELDKDSSDTVDIGSDHVPSLAGASGQVVVFNPSAAGNYRLVAYLDLNGNGAFDEGEQLRVMRLAVVQWTLQEGTNTVFTLVDTLFPNGENFVSTIFQNDDGTVSTPPMSLQAQYLLEGGGEYRLIGAAVVRIGNVGNLVADTFVVSYPVPSAGAPAPGNVAGTEQEAAGQALPMFDTMNLAVLPKGAMATGGSAPFRTGSKQVTVSSGLGLVVQVTSSDAPSFGPWDSIHPVTMNTWTTTSGGNSFREFLVGFTLSSPQTYIALNQAAWALNVTGTNDNDLDIWTKGTSSGQGVTGDQVLSVVGAFVVQTRG
jgi:hypothetical protein